MRRLLLLSMLTGCDIHPTLRVAYLAPELIQGTVIQYVREFNHYCPNEGKTAFIAIVSKLPTSATETAAGTCTLVGEGGGIYIKLDAWLRYSEMQRRALICHELAHAELGKRHDPNNWLMVGDGVTEMELEGKTIADVYAAACGAH